MRKIVKYLYLKFMYGGNRHKCPICENKNNKFLAAGLYQKRPNEKCPFCGSLTRHRHMWTFLQTILKEGKTLKIIHFAPEKSLERRLKKFDELEYYTSEYEINQKSDYHFNIEAIDLPNDFCDLIICSHVLEHITDDKKAIKELFRILKPGGSALIQVPIWPSEQHPTYENPLVTDPRDRIIHFGQYDHLRIYGLDIISRLSEAGFSVEMIDIEQWFSQSEIKYYGLHNHLNIRELIFKSTKTSK